MVNAIIYPIVGEDLEWTLKKLRRILEKSGALKEYRRHEAFQSRSQRRRSKIAAAMLRKTGVKVRVRS